MIFNRIKEAARYYDCSETTVRRMAKRGDITRRKEGRYFVFELKDHPGPITFAADPTKRIGEIGFLPDYGPYTDEEIKNSDKLREAVESFVDRATSGANIKCDDRSNVTGEVSIEFKDGGIYERTMDLRRDLNQFAKNITDREIYKRKMKPAPDKEVATLLTYASLASIILSCILYF